jgi:integrase
METDDPLARILAVVEAQGARIEALTERVGPKAAPREPTVRDVFERFCEVYRRKKCWPVARNRLTPFAEHFGADPVSSVTAPRWASYRELRKGQPGRKVGTLLSPLTVNFELDWAKRMFNWALEPEQALITANPLALAKREKTRSVRETWLSEEDVQAALGNQYPRNDRIRVLLHAFFLCMVDQGLRFNEARKLRRDRCRERDDGRVLADVGRTKNGKTHFVGLTARTWRALSEIPPVLASPHYFANHTTRNFYAERTMRRWFRELCLEAQLDARVADGDVRLRPHDLRRSAATAADRRGASLSAIQDMLNHSTPAITVKYIRRSEESAVQMSLLMESGADDERRRAEIVKRRGPQRARVNAAHTHTSKLSTD